MGNHFGTISNKAPESTPKEWLKVGVMVGELCNRWAERYDLLAFIGPKAGMHGNGNPPTALFNPGTAEVQVNTDVAFGKATTPAMVGDLQTRLQQFEFPQATGAIFHEACHARFTTFDLRRASEALTPNEYQSALMLLEEGRIEKRGAEALPGNKAFLRACALQIVIGDLSDLNQLSGTRQAAHMAALSLARVDAGVLEEDDVTAIRAAISPILGPVLLARLRGLWQEFQAVRDPRVTTQVERLYDIARRWNKAVQDAAEENGEGAEAEDGNGVQGGEQGAGSEAAQGVLKEIMEALGEDAEATEVAAGEALGEQKTVERYREQAEARSAESKRRTEDSNAFQRVPNAQGGSMGGSRSRLAEQRPPSAAERAAAVVLGRELERAKYRDRVSVETASMAPPGRLRSRAAVQGAAYRSKGLMTQAEPWRRTQRKHVEDPNLSVGVMVDISGSMGGAMQAMASTAWILSEAVRRIQGRAAMVYYGSGVFATLAPGQHLTDVKVYTASDSSHAANLAQQALCGGLNLIDGSGARLLVVVSDGQYGSSEGADVERWMTKMERAGVGILWLGYGRSEEAEAHCRKHKNAEFIPAKGYPEAIALEIGRAAARALTNASAVR